MEEVIVPIVAIGMIFVAFPAIVLHFITEWRKAGSLTARDEELLDDLYETARRLEERLITIERIIAADHPEFDNHKKY